ncbi:sigma-70 family RNA polymerase sigma factor [Serinicoccus marinus]|uniref:sigma-70 family RNA polymerase sigma factor n=1 Tax=Serinicoccus marinus TaxID=247333 RepID=UPI0003B6CBC1|nr:sigma-70 family RNA polymerase sigma factor [Serinicoccus marinus]
MSTQLEQTGQADFEETTAPLRGELIAHCYRMLGSASEAEDLVQETYLRAWKAYHRFEGRSTVRTWMYTIATNACLTALKQQGRRPLPSGLGGPPGDPRQPVVEDRSRDWLEPLPDQLVWGRDAVPVDPADATEAAEGTQLAFMAALQELPPLQRAVLVLRDVLQFSAAETAAALDTTVASVNSALQRSRATIGEGLDRAGRRVSELTAHDREVFAAFCDAFERHDIDAVVGVMTEQAVWQMPPFDRYYVGREDIAALIEHQCPARVGGDLRMLPVVANGQPAVGMYLRGPDGAYQQFQLCVVDLRDGVITGVVGFFDGDAFAHAGLPEQLPAAG